MYLATLLGLPVGLATSIGLVLVLYGSFRAYRRLRIEKDQTIHELEEEIKRLKSGPGRE